VLNVAQLHPLVQHRLHVMSRPNNMN
jgi:hypothetical protein